MNDNSTVSRNTLRNQEKPVTEQQLSNINWVWLIHPSGRHHRFNPSYRKLIEKLLEQGWKKSPL